MQEYIEAKLSGVAFSIDLVNGTDNIYIEFVSGRCEQIVSGHVTPESEVFNKNNVIASNQIPKNLVEYIIKLELLFGTPVDVEWCIDNNEKIWILQCRPITTIPQKCYQYAWSTREPLWATDLAFKTRSKKKNGRGYYHNEILYTRSGLEKFDCYIGLKDYVSVLRYSCEEINNEYEEPIQIDLIDKVDEIIKDMTLIERYNVLSEMYCQYTNYYMRSEPIVTDILERNLLLNISYEKLNSKLSNDSDLMLIEQFDFSKLNCDDEKGMLDHIKKYPYLVIDHMTKDSALKHMLGLKKIDKEINNVKSETAQEVIKNKENNENKEIKEIREIEYLKKLSLERMLIKKGWAGVLFYMMDVMASLSKNFNESIEDLYNYYLSSDVVRLINTGVKLTSTEKATRKAGVIISCQSENSTLPTIKFGESFTFKLNERLHSKNEAILNGRATFGMKVSGEVKIVDYINIDNICDYHNKIIVTEMTQPNMIPLFRDGLGIITNEGGVLSHACIISREYNIPCIVGTKKATFVLKDGDRIIMWPDGAITYDNEIFE